MSEDPPKEPYAQAFDKALSAARERHRSLRQLSPESALRRAQHFLSGDGTAAIMHEPSADLVDALIRCADERAGVDAPEAVRASRLAVQLADQLDPSISIHHSAQVRALTSLVSTARSAGEFDTAHLARNRLLGLLLVRACAPDDEIDALLAVGRLYFREQAFRESLFFAEEALELAEEIADAERTAHSLRLMGAAHIDLQDHRQAIGLFWRAQRSTTNPRTIFVCCQNLAMAYCARGHHSAAHEMLDQAERLLPPDVQPQDEFRLLWARATTFAGAGDGAKALETLEAVSRGFLHLQRPQPFAESVLEIALVLVNHPQGQGAARGVALLAADWFDILGLAPQSIAARAIVHSAETSTALRRGFEALKVSLAAKKR